MALKRRRYEAQKNAAQEYSTLIASRVKEEKAKKVEIKKRRQSSRRISQAPGSKTFGVSDVGESGKARIAFLDNNDGKD